MRDWEKEWKHHLATRHKCWQRKRRKKHGKSSSFSSQGENIVINLFLISWEGKSLLYWCRREIEFHVASFSFLKQLLSDDCELKWQSLRGLQDEQSMQSRKKSCKRVILAWLWLMEITKSWLIQFFWNWFRKTHRCCCMLRVSISWLCCQWCCISISLLRSVALCPTSSTSIRSARNCACRTCHSGSAWSLSPLYMWGSSSWVSVAWSGRTALKINQKIFLLVFWLHK